MEMGTDGLVFGSFGPASAEHDGRSLGASGFDRLALEEAEAQAAATRSRRLVPCWQARPPAII